MGPRSGEDGVGSESDSVEWVNWNFLIFGLLPEVGKLISDPSKDELGLRHAHFLNLLICCEASGPDWGTPSVSQPLQRKLQRAAM